ncbi:aspartate aminotransferase family protein [Limobrevibacterium gyesilva]|uniref:Aspartate aminotransferase family protein n=1 Tax=Limobrevibacterium gyesilva TaxID=2991712 RepID=A0AA41YIB4_9PROT|nr:aspartate aminotransferase family protein [Limobrevibacterium gyesilva]MCW3474074.1 aspartate aminotransferase family protein [Limobrevibacterium gyesilva]
MAGSSDVTAADRRNWRDGTLSFDESRRRIAEASQWLAGGVSSNFRLGISPTPLVLDHGDGAYLFDADGNRLIDYYLGMGPMILGHTPQDVRTAVEAQLAKGILFGGQSAIEAEAARLVCEMVPCAERIRFNSSGSEAVQTALRLARAATGRRVVVKFEGHYHGWFDNILWSTTPPADATGPVPGSRGQILDNGIDIAVLPWNDLAVLRERLAQGDVAMVIMEAAMCNQGAIHPLPGYLEGVREACTKTGTILVFDEVITGFRVSPGGIQKRLGVTPDLATFAKAIANGFPVAAIAGRADLMELMANGVMHGGTYNGQAVAMAATVATLRRLQDPATFAALETRGTRLMQGIQAAFDRAGIVATVTGFPEIFHVAIGLTEPARNWAELRRMDRPRYIAFTTALLRHGVRALERGAWFLSTEHDDAVIDATLDAVGRAVQEI